MFPVIVGTLTLTEPTEITEGRTVRGEKAEDLSFPVESVSCYRVNEGGPGEFWQVVAKARTVNPATANGGAGWSSGWGSGQPIYQPSQSFRLRGCMDRKLTETQAKGLVARIQGQGSICPARWDAGA